MLRNKKIILIFFALVSCVITAFAGGSTTYYANLTISTAGSTGAGTVYYNTANDKSKAVSSGALQSAGNTTSGTNQTYYYWIDINPGYNVKLTGKITAGPATGATLNGSVACAQSSGTAPGTTYTATATFSTVTVNSVTPTSIALDPTDPSADYSFTATFATSNIKTMAIDLTNSPAVGTNGKFTIINWVTDGNNIIVNGKFNGGDTFGGASRNNSTTLSLQSKATGSTAVTCVVTANFPALGFVNSSATDVFTTTTDATKTGTATYLFSNADENDFTIAPTITHTSGSGAFAITGYTVTPNVSTKEATVTVNYSFDPNGAAGDTKEQLKLTASNGTVYELTLTGTAEAEATDDAKVIAADGTTLIYQGDWATAWTKANTAANAGCTLQVLRNVSGLAANQTVTNTFTLDLNGKIVSGSYAGSIIYVNKSGKTLTIKDSKTGGRIENIVKRDDAAMYLANVTAGNLILESGTLYAENTTTEPYGACAILQKATTNVTINGGKAEAHGKQGTYGVYQQSNKANTTVLTMNGGEIYAEGSTNIYGITADGKVNINAGTVTGEADTQNARGINMTAYANATPANCYWGTLTMKGGTVNAINTKDESASHQAYGLFFDVANASMGTAVATDGSHANKAAATGSIDGATINATTQGRYSYGVIAYGTYQSKTNTNSVLKIKNSTINATSKYHYAYGVTASAGINSTNGGMYTGNIELTDCNVTATTLQVHTAYGVWASTAATTIYENSQPKYYGEYACGAKVVINSGNYTANAATTTAYAVGTNARAKSTYSTKTSVYAEKTLGGAAEACATLIIHGGTFTANAATTTARAVSNGGNCTIDGGEFYATTGTSASYGIYTVSGKLKASSVKVEATATTTDARGIMVDVSDIPTGDQAWTGFTYYGDAELNNLDVTAKTVTGATAYGVYVNAKALLYTEANFEARKTAGKWSANNYAQWKAVSPIGEAFKAEGKALINGGTYTVIAATNTANGVFLNASCASEKSAVATPTATIKKATFDIQTKGTTTACGVQSYGDVTINNCDFTIAAKTTTAYGILMQNGKATVTNTTMDVSGTTTVYGCYANAQINATHGNPWVGEFELGAGNEFTAAATAGNTAYGIYLQAAKRAIAAGGEFDGDYAVAGKANITDGTYKATATGTTAYAVGVAARQVQGSLIVDPECTIEKGKFWAYAAGGTQGIFTTAAQVGSVVAKGGYYNIKTNLDKWVVEGKLVNEIISGTPEYTEGYRYTIGGSVTGAVVCRVYSGTTEKAAFKTVEEAFTYVNTNSGTFTIVLVADNYILPKGDYILPSNATLLIPYKAGTSGKGVVQAIGAAALTTTSGTTPTLFRKLIFAKGANLVCHGIIETSAYQKVNGQYGANIGMASGPYGQIHLNEGSSISLENGAKLYCWGFVTGAGTIEAKKGSTSLEGFQLGDWCGGTNASSLLNNSQKVFPITHYFYQSIECPITYRPGSRAIGSTHLYAASTVAGQDDIALVGTSGSMFIMDDNDVSADTWVMKDYDETTDRCVWTINSGASIGNLTLDLSAGWVSYEFASTNYDLPITTNMTVVLNYGEMEVGQNTVFLPGSKLIVNKEGTAVMKGVSVVAYDATDWASTKIYRATYSPTWGTSNPRSTTPVDAEFFIHGKVDIRNNGGLYTTPSGANIHSTNEDAGEVIYTSAAQGNKTSYYLQQSTTTRTALTVSPAKLLNGDGTYAASAGTVAGKTWTYMDDTWQCWSQDGCLFRDAMNNPYAKPAAFVKLSAGTPDAKHLYYDAATGTRKFVWDENCYWWEVESTPTAEGYYKSINADNNGKYNYYEYNSGAGCWKVKTVTVTWNINGSTTNYSVGYGTNPEWLGATPTKSSGSSDYVCIWDGWTSDGGTTIYANDELPVVTANITYTAHFYDKYYQCNITFKNDNGKVLESKNWDKGSTPYCSVTPTKASTAAVDYTFTGWDKAIVPVTAATEYIAQYSSSPRKYTVTFVDYDNTFLADTLINYNDMAVYPELADEPYRESTEAFSYEWLGWTTALAKVTKDKTYVAKYKTTTLKYTIKFVTIQENGTETVHKKVDMTYGALPTAPASTPTKTSTAQYNFTFDHWDPAIAEVTGAQTYTAVYTSTLRSYTITWKNGSTTLETDTDVPYGTTPTYDGATPTKAKTAEFTYTFDGWTPAVAAVSGAQTYTAHFASTVNKYTITFLDGDNNVFATQTLDYGATPTAPAGTPTKTSTAQYHYTFDSWPAFTTVTGDKSYKATFTNVLRQYDIHFVNYDGTELQTVTLNYNTAAATVKTSYTEPTPTKPSSVSENYTFKGWTPTVVAVTAEATYTAEYTASARKYTIRFVNYDGTELQSGSLAYGATPTYSGSTPTRPDDATYSYTFTGWTPAIGTVSGDQTYTATYSTAPSEYGDYVDIIDWTANTVTVNANGYSSSATGAKWKIIAGGNTYTQDSRQSDRTLNISVSGLVADEKFFIETQDNTGAVESRHGYRVPYIYNGNTTLGAVAGDNKSVIFVRGGKLKVNANVQVDAIYVAPDAQLEIAEGVTLKANKLVLRCKPFSPAVLINNGTLTCSKVYYSFITTSNQQTYPFGLPIKSVVDNITFSNGKKATLGANFTMMYYDGASRAESGVTGNWKVLEDANVAANKGYNLLSASKYYCEYYFPITYAKPADGKTVAVTAYKGNLGDGENGWNYVVSPYTHIFTCNYASVEDQLKISTVSPDDYDVFDQYVPEVIYPNTPFFYQAAKSGSLSFAASAFTKKKPAGELVSENVPTQWLKLYFGSDQTGKRDQTNFYLHPDKFTEEYEIDYDLTKMSKEGSLPLIYTSIACGDLAFAALPDTLVATKNIPLTVFAPKADDMYFSLGNTNFMTRVESVLLYDNDLNNITDLMLDDYVCQLAEGTTSERFSLRVLFRKAEVATDIVNQEEQGGDLKVYVMGNTLQINLGNEHANIYCFDAVGKLIKYQPNASQSVNISVPAAGVYFLQIGNKVEKVIVK
ncbi:MAG: T9SS type A sorting domain-containing protein [Paludibacteraceae bacterium]|nr:T9SS type A sorting domain-containing protein [Paludibacteraceae bacterium]